MKTAICYYSYHHGNTRKVVEAMAEGRDVDLFDLSKTTEANLEAYDLIGFASGIYAFSFHRAVTAFARRQLPEGKRVFFAYTYGGAKGMGTKEMVKIAREKQCVILGESAAGVMIPSARSSWWADAARAFLTKAICVGQKPFSAAFNRSANPQARENAKGRRCQCGQIFVRTWFCKRRPYPAR